MAKQKKYKITKEQQRLNDRRISREIELEKNGKWISVHKVHPSKKTYNRNQQPKPGADN